MATAPITSTAARDVAFASRNEDLKTFAPKAKVNEPEANKSVELKATENVQEAKQVAKPSEERKQAPVVNTRGEVTGSTINTSA